MKIKFGIMLKLFLWYFVLVSIFYGTILVLFIHINQIMRLSENVVNKNFKISSASKKMIESLLWMEESENKYDLLKRDDYRKYFVSAQKEFEGNLVEIILLDAGGSETDPWRVLYKDYLAQLPGSSEGVDEEEPSKTLWIPEEVINDWIQRISKARSGNELDIESQMRGLNERGQMAVKLGLLGLGVSVAIGLLGSVFLSRSMNRPLRELRKGIRSISQEGLSEPIPILSKDEFGELASAFNEMAARLKEEEHMRSDFISMLSHEVRTPLTSIRESVNLISEEVMGAINERQRRFLEIASCELQRICELLNHLMQVCRLEAGALKINPQMMDPSTFVNGSIYRLTPAAEAKGIKLGSRMPEEIPHIMGDPEHLQQVLLNLIGNAIKFSPSGSDVEVLVESGPSNDVPVLKFSVSDSGPGIPKDELSMVFHKYYRASGTRDRIDGVGLGLSISKLIVEAHGGRVWVESKVGSGSTFGFSIPTAPKE